MKVYALILLILVLVPVADAGYTAPPPLDGDAGETESVSFYLKSPASEERVKAVLSTDSSVLELRNSEIVLGPGEMNEVTVDAYSKKPVESTEYVNVVYKPLTDSQFSIQVSDEIPVKVKLGSVEVDVTSTPTPGSSSSSGSGPSGGVTVTPEVTESEVTDSSGAGGDSGSGGELEGFPELTASATPEALVSPGEPSEDSGSSSRGYGLLFMSLGFGVLVGLVLIGYPRVRRFKKR